MSYLLQLLSITDTAEVSHIMTGTASDGSSGECCGGKRQSDRGKDGGGLFRSSFIPGSLPSRRDLSKVEVSWVKSILCGGNSACKGPETLENLSWVCHRKEALTLEGSELEETRRSEAGSWPDHDQEPVTLSLIVRPSLCGLGSSQGPKTTSQVLLPHSFQVPSWKQERQRKSKWRLPGSGVRSLWRVMSAPRSVLPLTQVRSGDPRGQSPPPPPSTVLPWYVPLKVGGFVFL